MKLEAYIIKPHLTQKTWGVDIEPIGVSREFKTKKETLAWVKKWASDRGLSIKINYVLGNLKKIQ